MMSLKIFFNVVLAAVFGIALLAICNPKKQTNLNVKDDINDANINTVDDLMKNNSDAGITD